MKHKLFIIFALVLVFGAMMAFSVSAADSYVVYVDSGVVSSGLTKESHDNSADFAINNEYPSNLLYTSSVSSPVCEHNDETESIYKFTFTLENFQPDYTNRQNWFVFLKNDYVFSNETDVYLTFAQDCATGEGYYTYGEDYETYVLIASRDNSQRMYVRMSAAKTAANVIVPKGYEVVVYTVVKSNKAPGKDISMRFGMRSHNAHKVDNGIEYVVGNVPFVNTYLGIYMDQSDEFKEATDTAYEEGYDAGEIYGRTEALKSFRQNSTNFFQEFGRLFFKTEYVDGEVHYSGIIGGIFEAYLKVSQGISLFGISIHTIVLTLLVLVVLGIGVKFVFSIL